MRTPCLCLRLFWISVAVILSLPFGCTPGPASLTGNELSEGRAVNPQEQTVMRLSGPSCTAGWWSVI